MNAAKLGKVLVLFVIGFAVPVGAFAAVMQGVHGGTDVTAEQTDTSVRYSQSAYDITRLSDARIEELAENLTPEQRRIILNDGTEQAFCGTLLDNKKDGVYACALCSLPLFSSNSKFDSGSGWPSFFRPVDEDHVDMREDTSFGMVRTEIECTRCGGHLGHVFTDGPKPTGLRFCVNSESLVFYEDGEDRPDAAKPIQTETAYFAGGCFWGVEDRFQKQDGVISAVSGYQGGDYPNDPTYRKVITGKTGHAETVRVVYDPARIRYEDLLAWFFRIHDPTQGNRQGPDIGTQYRSVIFTTSESQHASAQRFLEDQQREGRWSNKEITTELRSAQGAPFYEAEAYHQDYYARNGGTCYTPIYDE